MDEHEPTGRAKGGFARAGSLSSESRREIAKQAAAARWSGDVIEATHGSADHPLKIGDIKIPCYVLSDERRVITLIGMLGSLDISKGGASRGSLAGDRLTRFARGKSINPFITNEVMRGIQSPIRFKTPGGGGAGGSISYGYEATILADLCDAVLAARRANALTPQQLHIADRCEVLVRGFARVGIVALVDEATGYQRDRAKDALAKILEAFVAKELQPYVRTFPTDYYEELFRLRGLVYPRDSVKRPQYFGTLTNDIVYKRLAPGVLYELKRIKIESGKQRDKLFQRLTSNIGYPKLREHLGAVVAIMKLSHEWQDFMQKIDRLHPRYGSQMQLPLEYKNTDDDGKGL